MRSSSRKPLTKAEIRSIVDLLVQDLSRRLKDKQLTISLTGAAKDFCGGGGLRPHLRRASAGSQFLQSQVETMVIAKLILQDDPLPGTTSPWIVWTAI